MKGRKKVLCRPGDKDRRKPMVEQDGRLSSLPWAWSWPHAPKDRGLSTLWDAVEATSHFQMGAGTRASSMTTQAQKRLSGPEWDVEILPSTLEEEPREQPQPRADKRTEGARM